MIIWYTRLTRELLSQKEFNHLRWSNSERSLCCLGINLNYLYSFLTSYRFVRCGETLFGKSSLELITHQHFFSIPKKLGPHRNIPKNRNIKFKMLQIWRYSMYSGMDSYLYDVHDVAISTGMWALSTKRWSKTQVCFPWPTPWRCGKFTFYAKYHSNNPNVYTNVASYGSWFFLVWTISLGNTFS